MYKVLFFNERPLYIRRISIIFNKIAEIDCNFNAKRAKAILIYP